MLGWCSPGALVMLRVKTTSFGPAFSRAEKLVCEPPSGGAGVEVDG